MLKSIFSDRRYYDLIDVKGLRKNYGSYEALKGISFNVDEGEIVGFLGPNGAGKSTTMNIITGYISYDEGEVKIGGYDILKNPEEAKKKIGYLPEIPPLYMDMTSDEYLDFVADLKKVPKAKKKDMIADIKESVKITDVSHKLIKNLSKGYKQRVGLAQAMVGYPEVLILDEPTVGLDPKQIIEIRDVIKSLGKSHTIILSSHILSEVSAVCDRVMILSKGNIVASGTSEMLSESLSNTKRYKIRVKQSEKDVLDILNSIDEISNVECQGEKEKGTIDFVVDSSGVGDVREAVFKAAVKNDFVILLLKSMDMSLEDIFLKVTSQENNIQIDSIDTEDAS